MPLTDQLPESRLAENLVTFAALLRREGLPVSTTETMDALSALQKIDLSSRQAFKSALLATLVKSRSDQDFFERLFDCFFVPPEVRRRHAERAASSRRQYEKGLEEAGSELVFKGEALRLTPFEVAQYSSMPRDQRERLQDFMHKTESGVNVEPRFRPVLEAVVKSHLRYCRSKQAREKENIGPESGPAGSGLQADGGGAGSGSSGRDDFLRETDIQAIRPEELPAAEQLLQQLSRRLAVKILRRRRSGPRSGPLDLRRSLRDNMRYGGTIFKLKHRPGRRSRQQILLLCDVSASMKQYSTFVIHFLHGLREAVRDLSCFSFSDHLENLSAELKSRPGLQHLLDRVIRRSATWGGGTNIGQALRELRQKYPELLTGRAAVIVVSDTKTVAVDQALQELADLAGRTRRIIWLNPLPREQWPDYRSVSAFCGLVEMWPCHTMAQLEQFVTGARGI